MELRDIEYFAVVAEQGNVRKASEVLGLSPTALSKSLRRLEDSMQARLVQRTARGVALTPAGAALLAQVHRLRLAVRDIRREAAEIGQGRAGHLRIGVGVTTAEDLPDALGALLVQAPRLRVQVLVADNDVLVPQLGNGELDLVFNVLPDRADAGCVQERLYDDEFVVCAAAHHRLCSRRRVALADMLDEEWALSSPAVLNVQHLRRVFADRGLPAPRVAVEARPVRLRLQICAATQLLSFSARRVLRRLAPQMRLRELPVEELRWRRSFGVICREDAYLPPGARRLIELLRPAER
jgi:DNA-binding transcriptional LysR family regulator